MYQRRLVSGAVGEGTTFQIFLPRHRESHSEAAARDVESQQARDLTGMGTLLLVEDEDAVRSFSARALRKKGYTVLEAGSGEQALEMLKDDSDPVDLLITDVVMPQVDGPTLVKRVRESRPSLKVIFISGYTEGSFRKHLDDDNGVHFLAKPFSLKQLAGTVKEVLHEAGG
jgi:two-component system cell cycle sensor histidine kinase/response regulator CckA